MKNLITIHNLRLFKSEVVGINADASMTERVIYIYIKSNPTVFKIKFESSDEFIKEYKSLEMQMMESE